MKTPVVLITFNRPQLTQKIFDVIKQTKPAVLFLLSDGPRNDKEKVLVDDTRRIIEKVDWPCTIYKKYSSVNLGCRKAVSEGLDFVFSKVDRAIILEDDCVPDLSFFTYCRELLKMYENELSVMMISGNNFIPSLKIQYSYDYCYHTLIWGWATWKRAWKKFKTAEIDGLEDLNTNLCLYQSKIARKRLRYIQDTLEQNRKDIWDYIWQLALLMNNGLCIFPAVNLVKNIGFGKSATHTRLKTFHADLPSKPIPFPLIHPPEIVPNKLYDTSLSKTYSFFPMICDILKRFFQLPG